MELTSFELIRRLKLLNVWPRRLALVLSLLALTWKRIWKVSRPVSSPTINSIVNFFLATVDQLINHALQALRDTLPAEDRLTKKVEKFLKYLFTIF
jgi:hypothetical protein